MKVTVLVSLIFGCDWCKVGRHYQTVQVKSILYMLLLIVPQAVRQGEMSLAMISFHLLVLCLDCNKHNLQKTTAKGIYRETQAFRLKKCIVIILLAAVHKFQRAGRQKIYL